MNVKTYRAKSMQAALELVRRDLGPQAAVLHTRQVPVGLFPWLTGSRQIEVVASAQVQVPSRLPPKRTKNESNGSSPMDRPSVVPTADTQDFRTRYRDDVKQQLTELHSLVEQLCQREVSSPIPDLPASLFHLFTELIESEVQEELARELVTRIREDVRDGELEDSMLVKARLTRMIEQDIQVTGPLQIQPGKTRLVALIGPTGVGKTTTIAKLAANYGLREKVRVGLITVDTYRIAAVDQLRTYADIIDLPMEVVSTPREMREAVAKLNGLDLILMDTAGRSPRDEVKIQELKSMLAEARPDEVHLVLSSCASAVSLRKMAERFAEVGTTALLLTKIDEANGLGNLLSLTHDGHLPLSYLTNGQNVPDDIEPVDPRRLTRMVLGMENSD